METALADYHAATGRPAFAPMLGRCGDACRFWEHRAAAELTFVCHAHRNVHFCGPRCDVRMATREHEVCRLTGFVLGDPPAVWQTPFGTTHTRALSSHMGPSAARPSKVQTQNAKIVRWAVQAVSKLLSGKDRDALLVSHRKRLANIACRERRTRNDFGSMHSAVAMAALRAGRAGAPPLRPGHPVLLPLGRLVGHYMVRLKVQATARAVSAMAAALITRLADGYTVGGVVVVPRLPVVAAHAPCELHHPQLLKLQCRAVSAAHRLLVTAAVTEGGYARSDLCFRLSPARQQQSLAASDWP